MFERLTLLKQCRNNATVFKQYGEIKYISNASEILYFIVLALDLTSTHTSKISYCHKLVRYRSNSTFEEMKLPFFDFNITEFQKNFVHPLITILRTFLI